MTIREKVIPYTGGPENIVDFDNNYRCCNCDGYDDHALAPTYYDGAKEEQEVIKAKLEKWCYNNLFTGTYCVETSFETIDKLLEDLFKYLDL